MKNVIETLEEKYNNVVNNDKAKLAKFLKRRRIELGYTLEETSEGICSTSYLSKIENCQVDVDENYYNLLFERLNLEYKTVVENRMVPIYPQIIKAYLNHDLSFIESKLNGIVKGDTYCDTEIELLVIIYNLTVGNLDEVKESIHKLELIKNTLSLDELLLLSFLSVSYYYHTYDLQEVSKNIDVLLNSSLNDELMHFSVMDLALNFYFTSNMRAKFYKLYQDFKNNNFTKVFKKVEQEHALQELVLLSAEGTNVEQDFELIKPIIDDNDKYNYYYAMNLINKGLFEEAYVLLKGSKVNNKNLTLMAICVHKLSNMRTSLEFLQILKDTNFLDVSPYYDYLEYTRLKLEQYGYSHLHSFLKNQILPHQKRYHNAFLYNIELNEYQNIAFELGRYKEVVRFHIGKN